MIAGLLALTISVTSAQDFRMRAPKVAQLNGATYSAADVKAEIEFGRGLAARILNTYPLVGDVVMQKYVATLGAGLAAQVGRPELTFHFAVIDSPDVNAYACPGGYILLTHGLVKLLANEAELVGVLAHEIAHVNERHVVKKLKLKGKGDSAVDGLGAMIGGATASFRVAIQTLSAEAMKLLFEEGLMASEEVDADKIAIRALHATGHDVNAWVTLLEKLRKNLAAGQAKVLAKTHPKVEDRMQLVHAYLKNNPNAAGRTNEQRFTRYAHP